MLKLLRLVLSIALLFSGVALALLATTTAQTAPSARVDRSIFPAHQAITDLGVVNIAELAHDAAPLPRIESKRGGATEVTGRSSAEPEAENSEQIPFAPRPLPNAPIPSVHGQSPPVSLSFKSHAMSVPEFPADTSGAVGDNHVVTVTTDRLVVHMRDGRVLSSVTLDSFWSSLLIAGVPPTSTGDPKVLYDRFSDRFIIVAIANPASQTSATLIAVSQTSDPNGNYNRYAVDADAVATGSGGKYAEAPLVGFNKNWITIQVSLSGFGSLTGRQGTAIYVLNKAAAYDNTLSTVSTFENSFASCGASANPRLELGCGFAMAPAATEDDTTETQYLVENWDSTAGQLRLSRITGTPAAPVLTIGYQFPQSAQSWRFDAPLIGATFGYMPQRQQNIWAISGNRIAVGDARIQNAVLRNGSLWAVHHVMLPTNATPAGAPASTVSNPDNHVGIQWWEIDPAIDGPGTGTPPLQRGRIEDPTADNCHNGSGGARTGASTPPCAVAQGQFFAFPSITVNQNEDVLIGYTRTSHLTLAKAAYSFRAATDGANTMRDSQTFREGLGNYNIATGSPNTIRWGDYTASVVDPSNDTDFWTVQEYADVQNDVAFGPGTFGAAWATQWAQVKPSSTTSTAGNLIISEFRLRGPAGVRDEFVELYNPSDSPLTVTTSDGSDGWTLAFSANGTSMTQLVSIPNGTTIPARGHYLIANEVAANGIPPYSLRAYPGRETRSADADAFYTPDLNDNSGLAIFRTSIVANMTAGTRMDSVGFAGIAAGLFKEGTGIANITGAPIGQISFIRTEATTGIPQDTQDNAADFVFVDPVAETLGVTPTLGAAGPQNLDSPIHGVGTGGDLISTPLDPARSAVQSPNLVFNAASDPANESTLGTVTVRRSFFNNTGTPITRLRFRVVDLSTAPASGGNADLRARTSAPAFVAINGSNAACPGGSCTVLGVTLEEPPAQALSGGRNSSLRVGTVTLDSPLPNGATLNLNFLLGIQQEGQFRFALIAEALPQVLTYFAVSGCAGATCPDVEGPSVVINQAAGQADPANTSPVNFTVVFSEPVTNFTEADVTLGGTAGATTAVVTGSGTTYNVAVSGMSSQGTVTASIAAGVATDAIGNPNFVSTSSDNTVFFDAVSPNVTIDQAAGQPDPTDASPINFSVVFSEPVTDFATGDVTLGGTAGATTATVSGSGTTYNIAVSGMTSEGTVTASILAGAATDPAGNANVASSSTDNTVRYDIVAPTVSIEQAPGQADPAASSPINFTVVFSEAVTDFATGDVTLSGTAGATTATITGSGTTYNVAVSGMTSPGTVVANIAAGVATDVSGKPNAGSTSADNVVEFTPPPTQPLNISTRVRVETGEKLMIAGFIITGSAPKDVAVRALGPSLAAFGLDALADPVLEVRSSDGELVAQNDNWQETQRAQIQGGPFEPSSELEAVILTTLEPGAYTALITGKEGGTGVGLVEVYDTNASAASELANISTRAFVQGGDNIMIGGFILGGNVGTTNVAVRGLGPSLSSQGIADALSDPGLELYDVNGTLIVANDNYEDDPSSAAQLAAANLQPSDPLESGIFTSLRPGAYTATLSGNGGAVGVGLVEVYNVK